MSFESSRSMGRASTLFIVLGVIVAPLIIFVTTFLGLSSIGLFLSVALSIMGFAGQILFLMAMNKFASYYREPTIFKNSLYAFLTSIIGGVGLSALLITFIFASLGSLRSIPTYPGGASASAVSFVFSFLVIFAMIWIALFVIILIQSIFYRRVFNLLAEKSGEGNFKTAGLLMLIGGGLTIILLGSVIFLIGWFFALAGFFSMKCSEPDIHTAPAFTPQPSTAAQKRYCPFCGAEQETDAFYCSRCGKKL